MRILPSGYNNFGAEDTETPPIIAGGDLRIYIGNTELLDNAYLPQAKRNNPYQVTLRGVGGSGKYAFNYSGGIVAGMAYTGNGLIVGDPQIARNQIGNQTIDITMRDTDTGISVTRRGIVLTILDDGTAPSVANPVATPTTPATTTSVVSAIQNGATVTPYNDGKYLVSFPNGAQFLYNSEGILINRGQGSAFAAVPVGYSEAYRQWQTIQAQMPTTQSAVATTNYAANTSTSSSIIDDVKNFVAENKWYLIGGGAVLGYFYFKED